KTNKTMSPKAIAANRVNAQKTRGPKNMTCTSQNARKHGLLAKRLPLQTEEEKEEFYLLVHELKGDLRPSGPMEQAPVEEIAVCLWKLQSANSCEVEELANRREATKAIMKSVTENY